MESCALHDIDYLLAQILTLGYVQLWQQRRLSYTFYLSAIVILNPLTLDKGFVYLIYAAI